MNQNQDQKTYDDVREILEVVLQKMNIKASVKQADFLDAPYFQIDTNDNTLLIGENGQHLYALQTFVKRVVEQRRGGSCPPFLVDVGDYETTAKRILELLEDEKLREKMGKESLRIVKSKFEMSKGIDKHYQLYRSLIKAKTDWCLEKIKLDDVSAIITDFDRTITDKPGVINETVMKELDSLNKPLILVTGRAIKYAKKLIRKFPIWDCIIAENGSYVYFPGNGLCWSFTSDKFEEAKRILKKSKFPANFGNAIISVSKAFEIKLKEILEGIISYIGFRTNVDEVMVLPRGIDKGLSVKLALNYLGIDPKRTVIIGDGENDIDLFTSPGFKVAVANADERLKLFADEVTKKPSTQGIIEIIEKLRM